MPLRILLIDSDRDYRAWLGHHLAAARPDALIVAHDPGMQQVMPPGFDPDIWDLVFLDHQVGCRDGLDVLGELKRRPACPPIVFLAPQGDADAVARALRAGADDYLPKSHNSQEHIGRVVREAVRRGRQAAPPDGPSADADPQPEFRLKGHRCLQALATGSTSSVYLMEKERSEQLVVVKVFRRVPDQFDLAVPLQRFLREYEIVSGIRHPNVVRIFDFGIADDMAFIVMEYFAGGQLGKRIGEGLALPQALQWLAQAARALEAIHAVGVLHRDLKPANIMLRDDDSLALIDFGVAKLRDAPAELTRLGEIFGTPYYMSPEQGEGAAVDERADLYSLGVIFHEMLTGRRPYLAGSPMAIISKHCHAPLPVLPPPLSACQPLLERMMAKAPGDRFDSAGQLLAAVQALSAGFDAVRTPAASTPIEET